MFLSEPRLQSGRERRYYRFNNLAVRSEGPLFLLYYAQETPHVGQHGNGSGRAAIYLTNLLVSFHYFLIIYINSAFLSRYVDTYQLSLLYVAGSVLSIALFSYFATLVQRAGN